MSSLRLAEGGGAFLSSCDTIICFIGANASYIALSVSIIDFDVSLDVAGATVSRVVVLKGRCLRLKQSLLRPKGTFNVVLGPGRDLLAQLTQP